MTTKTKTKPKAKTPPAVLPDRIVWAAQKKGGADMYFLGRTPAAPALNFALSRYRGRYQNKPKNFWKLVVHGTYKGKAIDFEGRYLWIEVAKRRAYALVRGGPVKKAWKPKAKKGSKKS